MLQVITARPHHIAQLGPNLRAADRRECEAAGKSPGEALGDAYLSCDQVFTVVDASNVPHAMFGASRYGYIWLLGDDVPFTGSNAIQFLRQSRKWVNRFHEDYGVLFNRVHAKNEAHIRWLKWLGFQFDDPTPGSPSPSFLHFEKHP